LGGDGSGGCSFAVTIAIASLCSLVSIAHKEERENDTQREKQNFQINIEKTFAIGGLHETRKKGFSSI